MCITTIRKIFVSTKLTTDEIILLTSTAKAMELNIVHIYDKKYSKGGITVVFSQDLKGRVSMVTLAVAVCSKKDNYTRAFGRATAIKRFLEGETISLPIGCKNIEDTEHNVREFLRPVYSNLY
jgi:hypothetical protein